MALYKRHQRDYTTIKTRIVNFINAPGLYAVLSRIRPFTGHYFFFLLCFGGLIWYALFTRSLIGHIKEDSQLVTRSYAELTRTVLSEQMNDKEVAVIFTQVINNLNFPVILTDTAWRPLSWRNITVGNFFSRRQLLPEDTAAESLQALNEEIIRLRRGYEPKVLYINDSNIKTGYLLYGNAGHISEIAWMPFIEIGLVMAVILFAYIAFHNIRTTERSNLWVGLAKETAHQLGTPISSLMGWIEFLNARAAEDTAGYTPEALAQITVVCNNMNNDLGRLQKVTARFSQIGSVPKLSICDLNSLVNDTIEYFTKRLPILSRKVTITRELGEIPSVPANRELLGWVLENLIKNSLDAINKPDGLLHFKTEYVEVDKIVRITSKDNGKGIAWEDQKKVFSPGFTTKKRGWGLGLTLAKRIVEDYHNGHIYVAWSQKDKGATFVIDIPLSQPLAVKPPIPSGKGSQA